MQNDTILRLSDMWGIPAGTSEFLNEFDYFGPMMRVDYPNGVVDFLVIEDDFVCLFGTH